MALTLPIAGDSTRRGSGASFSSGCLRCLLLVLPQSSVGVLSRKPCQVWDGGVRWRPYTWRRQPGKWRYPASPARHARGGYFRVNERFRSLPDDLRPRGRCHCCQVGCAPQKVDPAVRGVLFCGSQVPTGRCDVVSDWAACSAITTTPLHRSSGAQAGRNGWSEGELCSGSPIAEPVPCRPVSANFDNASRIRDFGSVRIFGHDGNELPAILAITAWIICR